MVVSPSHLQERGIERRLLSCRYLEALTGLEPVTSGFRDQRSNQLNYSALKKV